MSFYFIILLFSYLPCGLWCQNVYEDVVEDVKSQIADQASWDLENQVDYNISSGAIFYDAKVGLNLIGPSGSIRTRVSDLNPIHISLPSLDVGCGGIDYSFGGINIASGKELVDAMKNIGINAATHAFLLSLVTISPEIKDVIANVQHWANQLNSININSCEIGSSLVESFWPASENTKQFICSNLGAKHHQFRDRISARHGCSGSGGEIAKKLANRGMEEGKTREFLMGECNFAWEVIKTITDNPDEQDLYLNISGTMIKKSSSQEGKEFEYIFYPSRVENAIDAFINGGIIENGYRFERTEGTVNPLVILENQQIFVGRTIDQEGKTYFEASGVKQKILKILKKQQTAFLEEGKKTALDLTQDEENFLSLSSFPIQKLILLMARKEGKLFEHYIGLHEIAEVMACDIAIAQVEKMLNILVFGAEFLQSRQVVNVTKFLSSLKEKQIVINQRKLNLAHASQEKYRVIDFLIHLENNVNARGEI